MEVIQANNKKVLTEWVNSYSDDLYNWAYHKLNKRETAKDMVQETFLTAFNQINTFKENASPKTWLMAILKNKVFQFYRTQYKLKTVSLSQFDNLTFNEKGNWIEKKNSNWNDDKNILDNEDFNCVFNSCIDDLPNTWKLIVKSKYIENKKSIDICKDLEISETNYWQIIHRSKLKLRHCLNANWFKSA